MNKKIILQLGTFLLLVQFAVVACSSIKVETSFPKDKESSSENKTDQPSPTENEPSSSEEETASSEKLEDNPLNRFVYHAVGLFHQMQPIVTDYQFLFEAVMREGYYRLKSSEHLFHLNKLQRFVEIAKEVEPSDLITKYYLVNKGAELNAEFDSDKLENPSDAILIMNKLFNKYGRKEVQLEMKKKFLIFIDRFNEILEKDVSVLTEALKGTELNDWYQSYKIEKDWQEQFKLFIQFFDFFLIHVASYFDH